LWSNSHNIITLILIKLRFLSVWLITYCLLFVKQCWSACTNIVRHCGILSHIGSATLFNHSFLPLKRLSNNRVLCPDSFGATNCTTKRHYITHASLPPTLQPHINKLTASHFYGFDRRSAAEHQIWVSVSLQLKRFLSFIFNILLFYNTFPISLAYVASLTTRKFVLMEVSVVSKSDLR
jgi:hypothetical protein